MSVQQQWIIQYSIQDLSKALIRQYLTQNHLHQTLLTFQNEDKIHSKKISKSILIKMLCLNTLFLQNKLNDKPYNSLLDILVNYLKNKFTIKTNQTNQTKQQQSKQIKCISVSNQQKNYNHKQIVSHDDEKTILISQQNTINQIQQQFTRQNQINHYDNKLGVQQQIQSSKNINSNLQFHEIEKSFNVKNTERLTNRTGGMRKLTKKQQNNHVQIIIEDKIVEKVSSKQQKNNMVENIIQVNQQIKKVDFQISQNIKNEKMVRILGKKKKQNSINIQSNECKKFAFDQNFIDQPLRGIVQKYQYKPIQLCKIYISKEVLGEINYLQKPQIANTSLNRKKIQKTIAQIEATELRKVIFQSNSPHLPKSWHQGFILSPFPKTPYGLKQIQGGPCGIIAAVQCYFLKHLLHMSKLQSEQNLSNQTLREVCLVSAIADLLLKVKSGDKIYLTLPSKNFTGSKLEISSLTIHTIDNCGSFKSVFEGIWLQKSYFIGQNNHGVSVLLYSVVMTKSIDCIKKQMDCIQNPLIGNHGHCTQQLVNLFITGKAVSNVFDNDKILQDNYRLRGITQKSQFGFLTIFETLKYIEVGKNLKNPIYPFWIICKEFHYHVIFANHYLIAQNNIIQKFDIVYFDGLYNCEDKIIITLEKYPYGEQPEIKHKELPLIQQVMITKWGFMKSNWNGSIKIL